MPRDPRTPARKSAARRFGALPAGRSLPSDPKLEEALAEALRVFAARPRPRAVVYCPHCLDPAWMERVVDRLPEELEPEELATLGYYAYTSWGDWSALAHYVPRLLELYAEERLPDEITFLGQLLAAAWPERASVYDSPPMLPDERRSIFRVVDAVADAAIADPDPTLGPARALDALWFLASLDTPVAPLIARWEALEEPAARGRFGVLVAEHALSYLDVGARAGTQMAQDLLFLPGNVPVMERLAAAEYVAGCLADRAEEMALLGAEYGGDIDAAFDWASAVLAAS
jgi:hypothetical protein